MTTILPNARSPFDAIMEQVGSGLSQSLPQAAQQRSNRDALQRGLGNIKGIANDPNATNLDVILSTLQGLAGIPGSERYVGQVLPEMLKQVESNRAQRQPLPGEANQPQNRNREPNEPMAQRQQMPERGFGENKMFPSDLGNQGGPGNVPQQATSGQKKHIPSSSEKPALYKAHQARSTAAGIPMTLRESKVEVDQMIEDDKDYNKLVDEERKERVEGQKTYGDKALEYLNKAYPNASDEVKAVFQNKGEEASKRGDSEAKINAYLAEQAKIFKNAILNAEKEVSAPRAYENLMSKINGNYKNFQKAANDISKHIQPLIDLGLYDTARDILSEKGYGIEEREAILHPLSNQSQSIINQVPNLRHSTDPHKNFKKPPADLNGIKQALMQLQEQDPNFSPALARKMFLDKGYDWKDFGNAWNELLKEGFKPSSDQHIQSYVLDSPPLNLLDEMLEGLNLIGR